MTHNKTESWIPAKAALDMILANVPALGSEEVTLENACGRTLAEDIRADFDLPPFDNSAVDGYAVRAQDTAGATKAAPRQLKLLEETRAGFAPTRTVIAGAAIKITTGGVIPEGADAVVMVEQTELDGTLVKVFQPVEKGENLRPKGQDVAQGSLVLEKGRLLRPAELAMAAAVGRATLTVSQAPRLVLLTTGDELLEPGTPLSPGKIYNSNAPALRAQITGTGGNLLWHKHLLDNLEETRKVITQAIAEADVIISSGGVSAGSHDFVKEVLREMGAGVIARSPEPVEGQQSNPGFNLTPHPPLHAVERGSRGGEVFTPRNDIRIHFERVAIQPGRPLVFATTRQQRFAQRCGLVGEKLFFGLPGNPASSMVTFEVFVRPALLKLMGRTNLFRPQVETTLIEGEHKSREGRRDFLRAWTEWRNGSFQSKLTGSQSSARVSSMSQANSLLIVPEELLQVSPGTKLAAILTEHAEIAS